MIVTMGKLYGENHPASKLTEQQVRQIRTLWDKGHRNIKVMARNFNVSPSNIRKIVKGETWKHLFEWPFNEA